MDWLDCSQLENFGALERSPDASWRWTHGAHAAVAGPKSGKLFYRFAIRFAGQEALVSLGNSEVRRHKATRDWEEFSGLIELPQDWRVVFSLSPWNPDNHGLGLLFHVLSHGAAQLPDKRQSGLCQLAFTRLETPSPTFAPCCRWWLEEELAFEPQDEKDPWQSGAAKKLRASMRDGSYRYCKLELCGEKLVPTMAETAGPSEIAVTADPRCNLACPSCRPHHVHKLTPQEEGKLAIADRQLALYAPGLKRLTLATDGEVFFSPYLRELLKSSTRARFPALEGIEILSNGQLFDERALRELEPGSKNIRWARISIDAGDAATYARTRGGDWERLLRNLRWIAAERKRGRFERLSLNFVVQKTNVESLPALARLAEELGADELYLGALLRWPRMGVSHDEEAITDPRHPQHQRWLQQWQTLEREKHSFQIVKKL